MRLDVICRTLNLDFAARSICFDSSPRVGHANDSRKSVHAHITFGVRYVYTSRSGRYADVIANIGGHTDPLSVVSWTSRSIFSTRIVPDAACTFTGPRTPRIVCAPDATVALTSVSRGT